jgi:predicted nucleotidyltransferase
VADVTVLTTASRSRAEDAAHRAVADLGATIGPGDDRLVGAQMVTLLVARYQPPDAPMRTTDADIGMRIQVVADGAFVDELTAGVTTTPSDTPVCTSDGSLGHAVTSSDHAADAAPFGPRPPATPSEHHYPRRTAAA